MTKLPNEQDKLWAKCPAGAIKKVADSAMLARGVKPAADIQRRKLLIGAATAAGVAVLGGTAYVATRSPGRSGGPATGPSVPMASYNFGGINCIEVARALPAFIEKTIDEKDKFEKIEKHLELCDKCRMIRERLES